MRVRCSANGRPAEEDIYSLYTVTRGHDASFNPNVGAGGGANWQRMLPTR